MAIRRECEETRARGLDPTAEEGFDGFQLHQRPKKQALLMASSSGQPRRRRPPALMGAGEIVEVEGGHIVRGTGRKDRHSKVYTARGIRDRRVRLSAHTAIQFYDVQDRLGYDRPSKAVDWLMKHAKASIDELEHLPTWRPTQAPPPTDDAVLLPPSLDSDAIADTIKSFFPAAAARYPPDLLSRTSIQSQDLRLSLHSFQDQIFQHQHQIDASAQQALLSDTAHLPFSNVWPEQRQSGGGGGGGGGGYEPMQQLLGQTQIFTQRGSLQSSSPLPFRAWMDPNAHQMHQAAVHSSPAGVDAIGFSPGTGFDFSSFHIPARIQGDIEHDGMSDELNSGSSA